MSGTHLIVGIVATVIGFLGGVIAEMLFWSNGRCNRDVYDKAIKMHEWRKAQPK